MKRISASSLLWAITASAQLVVPNIAAEELNPDQIQCPIENGAFCLDGNTLVRCANYVGTVVDCGQELAHIAPTELRSGFCKSINLSFFAVS
ncbi:hypothetical protein BZA05DRAFT_267843 [Tricharina praecox]|uniref:uncharacterized protein n=1 Tax=Tricharina praecox TaxID=43433 RepID=UPI00221F3D32|nr:uncharacterized protein BZA05DRAFT_267843 [Tricharina praecox]KAI5853725.1 hypothetical protein BZA05DRAFT_267843 [Tricharina praecox]